MSKETERNLTLLQSLRSDLAYALHNKHADLALELAKVIDRVEAHLTKKRSKPTILLDLTQKRNGTITLRYTSAQPKDDQALLNKILAKREIGGMWKVAKVTVEERVYTVTATRTRSKEQTQASNLEALLASMTPEQRYELFISMQNKA